MCVYIVLSRSEERVDGVVVVETRTKVSLFGGGSREREKKKIVEIEREKKRKKKKREFFKIIKKNPKHIGMEFRVCVVCFCFCA